MNTLKTSVGKFLQLLITFTSLTAIILYVKFNYTLDLSIKDITQFRNSSGDSLEEIIILLIQLGVMVRAINKARSEKLEKNTSQIVQVEDRMF